MSSISTSASISSRSGSSSAGAQSKYSDQLLKFCQSSGSRPVWQVVSDRRGGRTAWSATVNIQGAVYPARFWYDGGYINGAKEDAAQVALQHLGQLPTSGIQPAAVQQVQQQVQQPQQPQQVQQAQPQPQQLQQQLQQQFRGQQPRYYGPVTR